MINSAIVSCPAVVPQNILLRAALTARQPGLFRDLRHIVFEPRQRFWLAGDLADRVLLPLRGIISLQLSPEPGKCVEVGLVGREGFAGTAVFLNAGTQTTGATAQTSGEALVMQADAFRRACLAESPFREAAERYMQFFEVMLTRLALCNRAHVIEDLYLGRLLMMQDRIQADSFPVTQECLSRLLGVRRASINRIAASLSRQGLVRFERGRVTIFDRGRLETQSCSCYREIQTRFWRFLDSQGGF